MGPKTVAIIVGMAVLLGGGAVAAVMLTSDSDTAAETLSLVPENIFVYFETSTELTDEQRSECDTLAARFPDVEDCSFVGDQVREQLDKGLAEENLNFEDHVEPWLGNDYVAFMTDDDLGELIRQGAQPDSFRMTATKSVTISADGSQETIEETTKDLTAVQEAQEDVFVPTAAAIVSLDDVEEAESFVEENLADKEGYELRSHGGADYHFLDEVAYAVVEDHLVIGSDPGMKAVLDQRSKDGSAEDNNRFIKLTEVARPDRLGLMFVDVEPLIEAVTAQFPFGMGMGSAQPFIDAFQSAAIATAHVQGDGIGFETVGVTAEGPLASDPDPQKREEIVKSLPGDSWGALAVEDITTPVRGFLDIGSQVAPGGAQVLQEQFRRATGLDLEQDVLSWMGGVGLFVAGDNAENVHGGLTIETSDPRTTLRTILKMVPLVRKTGVRPAIIDRAGFRGFIVDEPQDDRSFIVVSDDERAVVALAPLSLLDRLEGGATLGDSALFGAAKEDLDDADVSGLFDIDVIRDLVESFAPADEVYESEVRPYLEPLEHVVFGSTVDEDFTRARLVIGVE